jgi:hypothetical protein
LIEGVNEWLEAGESMGKWLSSMRWVEGSLPEDYEPPDVLVMVTARESDALEHVHMLLSAQCSHKLADAIGELLLRIRERQDIPVEIHEGIPEKTPSTATWACSSLRIHHQVMPLRPASSPGQANASGIDPWSCSHSHRTRPGEPRSGKMIRPRNGRSIVELTKAPPGYPSLSSPGE